MTRMVTMTGDDGDDGDDYDDDDGGKPMVGELLVVVSGHRVTLP